MPATAADNVRDIDPLPYGFAAQGGVLDTLADYLVEQGLVADRVEVTDLFAASTRDL